MRTLKRINNGERRDAGRGALAPAREPLNKAGHRPGGSAGRINAEHIPDPMSGASSAALPSAADFLRIPDSCTSVCPAAAPELPAVPGSGGVPDKGGMRRAGAGLPAGRSLGKQVTLPRQLLLCACLNCPSQLAVIRDSVKMSKHSAFISPGGPRPPCWQPREIPRAPLPRMPSASRPAPAKGKLMTSRSKSLARNYFILLEN